MNQSSLHLEYPTEHGAISQTDGYGAFPLPACLNNDVLGKEVSMISPDIIQYSRRHLVCILYSIVNILPRCKVSEGIGWLKEDVQTGK